MPFRSCHVVRIMEKQRRAACTILYSSIVTGPGLRHSRTPRSRLQPPHTLRARHQQPAGIAPGQQVPVKQRPTQGYRRQQEGAAEPEYERRMSVAYRSYHQGLRTCVPRRPSDQSLLATRQAIPLAAGPIFFEVIRRFRASRIWNGITAAIRMLRLRINFLCGSLAGSTKTAVCHRPRSDKD